MATEGVRVCRPDIGPIEMCAICAGPVDMTSFHLTYFDSATDVSGMVGYTVDVDY
jgi:hypothetical protein